VVYLAGDVIVTEQLVLQRGRLVLIGEYELFHLLAFLKNFLNLL
jgi:hypothetical protein